MVIESTSDYWKPFYYLLDDALEVTGVSGRAMLEALTGRFNDHHRFMTRLFLDRIDAHTAIFIAQISILNLLRGMPSGK